MPQKIGKAGTLFYLRLGIAGFILLVLLRMVDFHHMGGTLASVKPQLIIVGLSIMLLNYCLKTYRWALILWVRRPDISFGRLARFNFVSIFLGSFLLSSVSADIARVYYVSQHTADPRAAISSIFADRIIGTFSLAIVTIAAFLVLLETELFPIGSILSYGIAAFLLLTLALPFPLRSGAVLRNTALRTIRRKKPLRGVQDMSDHLRSIRERRGSAAVMIKVLLISFVVFFFSKPGTVLEICFGTSLVYGALQLTCMLPGRVLYLVNGFAVKELSA